MHHRAVWVSVDADDVLWAAEASGVLDRAANSKGKIQRRIDDDAGGANLLVMMYPRPIRNDSGGSHGCTDVGSEPCELSELILAVKSCAATDDAVCLGKVHRADVRRQDLHDPCTMVRHWLVVNTYALDIGLAVERRRPADTWLERCNEGATGSKLVKLAATGAS